MEDTEAQLVQTQLDAHFSPTNVFLAVVFTIIMVTTIVGNALVLVAVMTTKKLQTITNHFLSSLSVADLLIGLIIMPPAILQRLNGGAWKLGQRLCDAWLSIDVLLCSASILSLCAISTDRYWSVTRPLSYSKRRRSKCLARRMIALSWAAALAIAAPLQLPLGVRHSSTMAAPEECSLNASTWYVVWSAVCGYFLPMLLMLCMYSRIYRAISNRLQSCDAIRVSRGRRIRLTTSRNKALSRPIGNTVSKQTSLLLIRQRLMIAPISGRLSTKIISRKNASSTLVALTTDANVQLQQRQEPFTIKVGARVRRSRVNAARSDSTSVGRVAVVVGAFLVCWLPFFVTYLASIFVPFVLPDLLVSSFSWLGWTNSTINPVIYTFYSAHFRQAFSRLIMFHKSNSTSPV